MSRTLIRGSPLPTASRYAVASRQEGDPEMPKSSKPEARDVKVGAVVRATFEPNSKQGSKFRLVASRLDGATAPRVVLSNDERIRPGIPHLVRVLRVVESGAAHGHIEVEFVKVDLQLEGIYLDPGVSTRLQILLESGRNILLDGPQGCGKTVLARAVAEQLGMEFVFFNCSAVVESTDFLATLQVRATPTGQPVTDFVKTELLLALEEAGVNAGKRYLVFLDELNRCAESARNVLMPGLDATRRVYNPVVGAFLAIPENVQFVAAVNQGSIFTGTYGIDPAQLDRFAPVHLDYLPPEEETKLLGERYPAVPTWIVRVLVQAANLVRRSPDVAGGLSVRATDEACTYLSHALMAGDPAHHLPEVLKASFCGRFRGRWNDAGSDAGVVWEIVQGTPGLSLRA